VEFVDKVLDEVDGVMDIDEAFKCREDGEGTNQAVHTERYSILQCPMQQQEIVVSADRTAGIHHIIKQSQRGRYLNK
jgi:hypothetical protein